MIKKFRINFALVFVLTLVLVIYSPVFSLYFSQDDFFHLNISQISGSWVNFVNFFGFKSQIERGYPFYRPLFREFYYFFILRVFGFNTLPFRLFSFLIHFLCITLVYLLMEKVFKRKLLSFLVSLFYGLSAAQVGTLYYHATGIQISGATFFLLLSIYFYRNFLERRKKKYWIFTLVSVLAALCSSETVAFILAMSLLGLEVFFAKKMSKLWLKKAIFHLSPIFLLFVAYFWIYLFKIGLPKDPQYSFSFSAKKIVNSFVWFVGWGLGLPEMLVDFVGPGVKLNPRLIQQWGSYFRIIFPTFFLVILMLFISAVYLFLKNRRVFQEKSFLFLVFWFPVALVPVVFLSWHKFLYYLNPALPALFGIIFFLILKVFDSFQNKTFARVFLGLFCLLLFSLSLASIKLAEKIYWPISRGKIARNLINNLIKVYPTLPKGAVLYFKNDPNYPLVNKEWGNSSTQAFYALSNKDAAQYLYTDKTIKVYYEDIENPPKEITQVFSLTAVINPDK